MKRGLTLPVVYALTQHGQTRHSTQRNPNSEERWTWDHKIVTEQGGGYERELELGHGCPRRGDDTMPCPEPNGSRIDYLRCHETHIGEQIFKFMELEHQPASVQIPLLRRCPVELYAVCMYAADGASFWDVLVT